MYEYMYDDDDDLLYTSKYIIASAQLELCIHSYKRYVYCSMYSC